MKKFCEKCGRSVKETGRLLKVGFLVLCRRCRRVVKRR